MSSDVFEVFLGSGVRPNKTESKVACAFLELQTGKQLLFSDVRDLFGIKRMELNVTFYLASSQT